MLNPLAPIATTIFVACVGIIPGCQPPKPNCTPYTTVTVDSDQETSCDLDGTNTLNVRYNPALTNESFITICFDHGGEPDPDVDMTVEKICKDEDF